MPIVGTDRTNRRLRRVTVSSGWTDTVVRSLLPAIPDSVRVIDGIIVTHDRMRGETRWAGAGRRATGRPGVPQAVNWGTGTPPAFPGSGLPAGRDDPIGISVSLTEGTYSDPIHSQNDIIGCCKEILIISANISK